MFDIIIKSLVPVFVIMLLGYYAGKARLIDNSNMLPLNVFVMDFAVPAALFSATAQAPWIGIILQTKFVVVLILSMWIIYILFYVFVFIQEVTPRISCANANGFFPKFCCARVANFK
jgi:predicted permease